MLASPHIFRTYDIRGVAERDLPNEVVSKLGFSFGQSVVFKTGLKNPVVGVGRDTRKSSPRIFERFCAGLTAAGARVQDLGPVTTPMTYFAHYHFPIDAIVQITASHNPAPDNGFKMMIKKDTLFGDEIQGLRVAMSADKPFEVSQCSSTSVFEDLRSAYLKFLSEHFQFKRKFKLVLDTANGMVGMIGRDAFRSVASELEILYEEVDCTFPNHEADPTVEENLRELQARVLETKADLGLAFDGDGDRLGVITPKGRILWGDEILMLLSEKVLRERPRSTIIGEVKCSEKLFRHVRQLGGEPVMYKTGHSLIKKKMKELGAPIAGEMSGHLFFADRYFGFDDAVYAGLRVLEVIDALNLDLDQWIESFPTSFVTPELRVNCAEEEKGPLVQKVQNYFSQKEGAELFLLDGVRVSFPDGSWALVRASNTQAVLVVRVEALNATRMKALQAEVAEALGRPIYS